MAEVIMPKMGDGMESGKLLSWKKSDGDEVKSGEIIAEIETDKSNVEIEAEDSGVFHAVAAEGQSVPIGQVIATIGGNGAAKKSASAKEAPSVDGKSDVGQASPPARVAAVAATATPQHSSNGGSSSRVKASPLARRVAREKGIALEQLTGSGPNGRIIEADIREVAQRQAGKTTPQEPNIPAQAVPSMPTGTGDLVEFSQIRRIIGRRMVESKTQIPHFYVTSEIDMEAAVELRKQLNAYDDKLPKISLNDFVVKASALALMKAPEVNRIFQGDKFLQAKGAHVGIAVALDDGLIVPVIRDAQAKSLRSVARESRELIDKARSRRLQPNEYSGGTFTVSNLGAFDVENFIAIIDPAQGAILAVGSIRKIPVAMPDDSVAVRQRMNVTLSGDHRVMDGASGARFLQELKRLLQNPLSLLEQ